MGAMVRYRTICKFKQNLSFGNPMPVTEDSCSVLDLHRVMYYQEELSWNFEMHREHVEWNLSLNASILRAYIKVKAFGGKRAC